MTPEQVVCRIAEVADSIAHLAGVGGMETAGMIVSALAARPELTARFLAEGAEFMLTGEVMPEKGILSFHRKLDGKVTTPEELRASLMIRNMERGRPADQARS